MRSRRILSEIIFPKNSLRQDSSSVSAGVKLGGILPIHSSGLIQNAVRAAMHAGGLCRRKNCVHPGCRSPTIDYPDKSRLSSCRVPSPSAKKNVAVMFVWSAIGRWSRGYSSYAYTTKNWARCQTKSDLASCGDTLLFHLFIHKPSQQTFPVPGDVQFST